jgi:GDP-4-dehydro-6-deoxy-D-mannose reductase
MDREAVLITGVSGFVGPHLGDALRKRGVVRIYGTILSRDEVKSGAPPNVELTECHLEDPASVEAVVRQAEPSVVYHLAAQSSVPKSLADPRATFQANVMGTLNLLESLRGARNLRSLILVSSAQVYGTTTEPRLPVREDAALDPANPYACSKACAELLGAQYFETFELPVVRVRPSNHIGPGQSKDFAVSSFACQVAEIEAGIRPPQIMFGNLDAERDFTDVRDVVEAYILATEKCIPGEAYNICSGRAVSIREMLDALLALTSAQVEIIADPERMRPSDTPVALGDFSKMQAVSGWSPSIAMEKTLTDLLDYWREQVRRPGYSSA